MTNETCPPSPTVPRYFADKAFDYVHLDLAFLRFADECSMDAEELLRSIEEAIATRHHEAVLVANFQGRYQLWELETDVVSFCYQVQPERVLIGDLVCKSTMNGYEPSQDLLADFD